MRSFSVPSNNPSYIPQGTSSFSLERFPLPQSRISNSATLNPLRDQIMTISCVICDHPATHLCFGACNHPICSTCALRLRFKNKDFKCPICKSTNDLAVVVEGSVQKSYQEFEFFGNSIQGGILLDETNMLFIDCADHFFHMKDMMSYHCPHPSCAVSTHRFTNLDAVLKHLQSKHQAYLCKLCYNHRSLFLSEHTLYSAKELKKHMKATGNVNVHPLCQFCSRNYYDAADLFQHMRNDHFTCRYCPVEFQHRYYRNSQSLNLHISESHWRCHYPSCAESVVAFASREEYANHMAVVHNSNTEPSVRIGFRFDASQVTPIDGFSYLDLHTASADPNIPTSTPSSSVIDYIAPIVANGPSIPSHMRIAGKVKNGVLKRDESDDAMERALTQRSEGRPSRHIHPRSKNLVDFPALSETLQPTKAQEKSAIHEPHPLSAMTKERRLKLAEAERQRIEAAEETRRVEEEQRQRRRLRNEQMARALGVAGETLVAESWRSLLPCSLRETDLDTPIYTPELLRWAKNCTVEVLRVERRLQVFLADKSANTLSLKPMRAHDREMVRALAKYYLLNSHEYDPEPQRYVALVKAPETQMPSVLLSSFSNSQAQVITTHIHELNTPSVYFTVKNAGAGMSYSILASKLITELGKAGIGTISSDPAIQSIRPFGPSGVRFIIRIITIIMTCYHR